METPMETPDKPKMTHSEFLTKLKERVENLKGGLDTLIAAKEGGNGKQVAYWVGKNARDLTELSKLCMGEIVANKYVKGQGGIII